MMWRFFLPGALALAMLPGTPALADSPAVVVIKAPAADVPVVDFFEHTAFDGASLSPDGRYVAMLNTPADSRVRLAVMEIETGKLDVVAAPGDADNAGVHWVSD